MCFINKNTALYVDSFGIEYIPEEVLNKIWDKSTTHNIFRIQDNESMFCSNDYKKNDKRIKKYKKTYNYLSYVENVLILVSIITGCV